MCFWPIIAVVWSKICGATGKAENNTMSVNIGMQILVCYLLIPGVSHILFSAFSCLDLQENETRVYHDLEIICWSERHIYYLAMLIAPFILIYLVYYPYVVISSVTAMASKLSESEKPSTPLLPADKGETDAEVSVFMQKYGFITAGSRWIYWELLLMITRVLVIASVEYFASMSKDIQALNAMFLILINLVTCMLLKPLKTSRLNNLTVMSFLSQLTFVYVGIFFLVNGKQWGTVNSTVDGVFIPILLVPQILFLLCWVYLFRSQAMACTAENHPGTFAWVSCFVVNRERYLDQG